MMTQVQELQMFWNDWGNRDLSFYKVYVQCGAISKEDYKAVTGQDYDTDKQTVDPVKEAINTTLEDISK